jgi:hypothetical protein
VNGRPGRRAAVTRIPTRRSRYQTGQEAWGEGPAHPDGVLGRGTALLCGCARGAGGSTPELSAGRGRWWPRSAPIYAWMGTSMKVHQSAVGWAKAKRAHQALVTPGRRVLRRLLPRWPQALFAAGSGRRPGDSNRSLPGAPLIGLLVTPTPSPSQSGSPAELGVPGEGAAVGEIGLDESRRHELSVLGEGVHQDQGRGGTGTLAG